MRVAIAGSGSLARYFAEEFPAAGIDIVILTRSNKPEFESLPGVQQYVTDYSVPSILEGIEGSSALISAILDYNPAFIDCGNLEDFPDQPAFYSRLQDIIRKELAEQDELEWTLLSTGWFVDYIVPSRNRILKDVVDAIPINIEAKTMLIPGSGKEPLDLNTARDVARAVAKLLQAPRWERYTYLSGEKTTWNDIAAMMQEKYPEMTVEHRILGQLIDDIVANPNPEGEERIIAEYGVFSASHAGLLPVDKVASHREKYFSGIRFRTTRDLLAEVEHDPCVIV
ncbi:hypothetical protein LZ30DRAFT_689391 [Colletotrichum cereale]|nr:hypothetical protein LZ30DRAFT_689391 [Colletotrichum cereale]